jgi:hypothetical protein
VGSAQLLAAEGGENFLKILIIAFLELRKDQLIETRKQKAEFIEKLVYRRKFFLNFGVGLHDFRVD